MNYRRSTRLANKKASPATGTVDNGNSGASGVIFEEGEGRHVSLRSRTPKTPYQRASQKRKRGNSINTPITGSETEVGRATAEEEGNRDVSPGSALLETPKILTQSHFQNGGFAGANAKQDIENGIANFSAGVKSDISFGNDSFLLAVDNIERNELGEVGIDGVRLKSDVVNEINGAHQENFSPDMFGDDEELFEALPELPPNDHVSTPTNSRSKKFTPKRLVTSKLNSSKQGRTTDFIFASEVLEQSLEQQKEKELPMRRTKRSIGEKKKKTEAQGAINGKKKKNKNKFKPAFTNRKNIIELANSASNELSMKDMSYMSNEEKLQLSAWSLPKVVLNNYRKKGITSLFPWQLECLANEKVLEGRNLLYSAPTSAGKTLVSEILMIKRVLELGRKAIMILPFVSVAREKVYSLQSIFGEAGVRVEGFMGSMNPPGGFKAVDIAICTIEKANSLINKLLEENWLADLGTLVLDELHLIGDPHRGYLLELLLTKIMYMTVVKNDVAENSMNMTEDSSCKPKRYNIQVIGMSATLPNLNVLADWLNAELYVTDFRPVPLKEHIKMDDELLDDRLEPVRNVKIDSIPIDIDGDTDNIIYLALETVLNGFSVLIFCPTKANVENTAERIAHQFFKLGDLTKYPEIGKKLREQLREGPIKSVLNQLRECPGGVDDVLAKTVSFGTGYHHAGLTYENRDIVESAFKRGVLRVIVATSTLSAGVNLPARRVIITTPMFNGNLLDIMTYHQMCGRAGRNGIDTEGESILICPSSLKGKGASLFKAAMPLVRSALLGDGSLTSSMKRALLEAIASGIASLPSDVKSYAKCTFLFHSLNSGLYNSEELSSSQIHKEKTIEDCLEYLESREFIRIKRYEQEHKPDEFMPTQLGSACLASSLSPDDGIIVYKELLKARECFVLENELHVIYQVTPIYVSDQLRYISWPNYLKIWEALDYSEKKVANLVGIQESFIIKAMIGTVSWKNPSHRPDMAIHQRFFAALALSDLVNEKPLDDVANKYFLSKGTLQNLQQASSTFAGMVTAFCSKLGWSNLELLLSQFQERLEFGVQRELCDLVRLDCLNGQRARILYDAGIKNIMELAATDPAQVEHILHRATPFISTVHHGKEKESHIWMMGKDVLSEAEAAQKIVHEARMFIKVRDEEIQAYTNKRF